MPDTGTIFAANRAWAQQMVETDPEFFARLSKLQEPEFLWIGCSDSRVPANQITGLLPGEVFVHRNVANIVKANDLNSQSVIQFSVDILKVRNIVVCGHYGCGGVKAALHGQKLGLVDEWISDVAELRDTHHGELNDLGGDEARHDRLCELNVIEQVQRLVASEVIQAAWARGQELHVHGWIYGLQDGLLKNLDVSRSGNN